MYNFFLVLGFVGQLMFTGRFLVQWIASERKKESVIPFSFWVLSLLGSSLLFIYAVYKKDPVFILGQSFGLIVYIRNMIIIKNSKSKEIKKDKK